MSAVVLDGTGIDSRLAGGKGAALDRLIGLGVDVPASAVLTTDVYRRFARHHDLDRLIAQRADAEADEVDRLFLSLPLPDELRVEILAAARRVRGDGRIAVRSSATAEDLASASFAGQYRSVLELTDDDEIDRAVRLVWASLWHPAPRAYRAHAGIDEHGLAMAVVLMRLVEAERAGVVFSVDPSGDGTTLRVEAVDGLAEELVSGSVTPDAFVLDRRPRRRLPIDPVIDEAVEAALAVERAFGAPVDVEWAHDGEHLRIVQARPITTEVRDELDPYDTPIGIDDSYTSAGVAEMLPGVLPPLRWTTVAPLMEDGFRSLFGSMDALPAGADDHPFIARVRGRAVLNLDLMRAAAEAIPGGSAPDLERQYFGRVISDDDVTSAPRRRRPFAGLVNMVRSTREIGARRRFRRESDVVIASVRELADEPPSLGELTDDELLAYRFRLLDLASRATVAEVAVAAAAAAAYRGLELFLEPHLGTVEAASQAQRLTAGGIRACGADLALDACLLAGLAMRDAEVARLIDRIADGEDLRFELTELPEGRRLLEEVTDVLAHAGSAAVFAGPTWSEQPELAWGVLRQSVRAELAGERRGIESAERERRLREARARFDGSLKYKVQRVLTGQVVDVRRRLLERLVTDAVDFLDRRETTKSAVLRLGGEVRRLHLEVGRRLVERGELDHAADVDLLDSHGLGDALGGRGPGRWELDRRRRALDAATDAEPPPQVFTGDPTRPALTVVADGDHLEGWAASAGTYVGPAKVLRSAADGLEAGDVLVARTTDPSWTPLFLTAGAIVVEEGGPLSHAAIIARELGLPAVLNVPGAVDRLSRHTGPVEVDGGRGLVTVLDDDSDVAVRPKELAA